MVLVYSTSFTEMKELLAGRVTPKNVYRGVGRHVRFHSIRPRIEMALKALNLNLNPTRNLSRITPPGGVYKVLHAANLCVNKVFHAANL